MPECLHVPLFPFRLSTARILLAPQNFVADLELLLPGSLLSKAGCLGATDACSAVLC